MSIGQNLRIVGLGGSLAATSRSRAALELALSGAEQDGAHTRLLDLRDLELPMYDPDRQEPGDAARDLMEACYGADGLIWSSPLYQGTISGAFKNALDWLHDLGSRDPPFLHDKVIGSSVRAVAHKASRRSTPWSSRLERSADGRCRMSSRSGMPGASSGRTATWRTRRSRNSSSRLAPRSCAWHAVSQRTRCSTAMSNAPRPPNGLQLLGQTRPVPCAYVRAYSFVSYYRSSM